MDKQKRQKQKEQKQKTNSNNEVISKLISGCIFITFVGVVCIGILLSIMLLLK